MYCFKVLSLLFYLLFPLLLIAQDQDVNDMLTKKYAENSFRDGDYEFALENYQILYNNNRSDVELNYRIGICYTEANIDKSAAIPYLEFVVSHNNYPFRTFYYLGRAYMYNYRFTEAVEAFYDYKMIGVNEEFLSESDRLINKCYNAMEFINQPINVTFERMDTTINTFFDDYNPFISGDNSSLYFSSNRTYVKDFEDYIENVFYSENKKGSWLPSVNFPGNTYDNEAIVGMTPLADKFLVYADGDYFTNDVKLVTRKGNKYMTAFSSDLPSELNTDGVEMGACMTPDGNTLIFSSDRRGGRGGLDLYRCTKDVSGVWSAPENLGSIINSEFDDNFPNISADGKTLYFASKGHSGVGGYDIFKSSYSDEYQMWTNPQNMKFPINNPLDNTTISFSADGREAYVAANRKEGLGNLDIYKVNFAPDSIQAKILMGTVMVNTRLGEIPYSEDFLMAYATIFDMQGNIYAQYPVESDGGNFYASLYPGEYKLEVKFSGAKQGFSKIISVTESTAELFMEMITLQNLE